MAASRPPMSLIELNGIGRSYMVGGAELKVLRDVTLTIEAGEFVAIVGPSGSGKSTLMQILGLLDRPTYGTYKLTGYDVSKLTDDEGAALRSKTIGFIFQMFNLLARTSTLDNVKLPMIYSGALNRDERAKALLRAGQHGVLEVCLEIGFESPSTFSAFFARHVGVSPSEYRRLARSSVLIPSLYRTLFVPSCFLGMYGGAQD